MHIIHDKYIVLTVLILEVIGTSALEGVEVINRKSFRGDIKYLLPGFLDVVPYCLDKVGLTVASLTINKERIVGNAWLLAHGFRCGVSEGVVWSNYECIK